MDQNLENKIQEIEQRKRSLRTDCNIANMATRDRWYLGKIQELNMPKFKFISKEEVLKEIEEIKKLESNLN